MNITINGFITEKCSIFGRKHVCFKYLEKESVQNCSARKIQNFWEENVVIVWNTRRINRVLGLGLDADSSFRLRKPPRSLRRQCINKTDSEIWRENFEPSSRNWDYQIHANSRGTTILSICRAWSGGMVSLPISWTLGPSFRIAGSQIPFEHFWENVSIDRAGKCKWWKKNWKSPRLLNGRKYLGIWQLCSSIHVKNIKGSFWMQKRRWRSIRKEILENFF